MPYRNRDPQGPWRAQPPQGHTPEVLDLESPVGRRNKMVGGMPRWRRADADDEAPQLRPTGPFGVDDVQVVLSNPRVLTKTGAKALYEALIDQAQPLTAEAEPWRTALYNILRARMNHIEDDPRLKQLQRLEGCQECGSYEFTVDAEGLRDCANPSCANTWQYEFGIRQAAPKSAQCKGTPVVYSLRVPNEETYRPVIMAKI